MRHHRNIATGAGLLLVLAVATPGGAAADLADPVQASLIACSRIGDDGGRLRCFDKAANQLKTMAFQGAVLPKATMTGRPQADLGVALVAEAGGPANWSVAASPDGSIIVATTTADGEIADRFGKHYRPTMSLRCSGGDTAVYWQLAGLFVADSPGYGEIDVAVDGDKERSFQADASDDNQAIGIWSGSRAISLIGQMVAGGRLTVRLTPFYDGQVSFGFDIADVGGIAGRLQVACNWPPRSIPVADKRGPV